MARMADLSDGKLNKFLVNPDLPKTFENKDKIYWRNGPSAPGFVGVWDWTAYPNNKDSEKDYVKSNFNSGIVPTEVVIFDACKTMPELISVLQTGYTGRLSSKKFLFAYRDEDRNSILICLA